MRVSCPRCQKRFDIPHVAVLVESRRLADVAKAGKAVVGADGNRLDPDDDDALEQRAEAIRRRKAGKPPP